MIQIQDENGNWIEGQPVHAQLYRIVENGSAILESYWAEPAIDARDVYTISESAITAEVQPLTPFAGNHYCQPGDTIQLRGNITDSNGDTVTSIAVPVTLKMPLVRHANGLPTTDETYLNVTIAGGVMTATGKIERSGDWRMLNARNNEVLRSIGATWKLEAADVIFLA